VLVRRHEMPFICPKDDIGPWKSNEECIFRETAKYLVKSHVSGNKQPFLVKRAVAYSSRSKFSPSQHINYVITINNGRPLTPCCVERV